MEEILELSQWTSCEVHGHVYQYDAQGERFGHCLDCGEGDDNGDVK